MNYFIKLNSTHPVIYHDAVRGEFVSWEGSDHTVFRHMTGGVPCTLHILSTSRASYT